jgi:peptidoglycan glycosyltransferase
LTNDISAGRLRPVSDGTSPRRRRRRGRRSRLLTRALPALALFIALAVVAMLLVVYAAGSGKRSERALVRRYVGDWSRADYPAMYGLLSADARTQISEPSFAAQLSAAAQTATTRRLSFGRRIRLSPNHTAQLTATVYTSAFGTLHETVALALDPDDSGALNYRSAMRFPGLRAGERLSRTSVLGARGTIEASDGTPLAQGVGRTSPIPAVADEIVGSLGPIPAARRAYYRSLGYPANAQVGHNGLELIFQRRLGGTPGGILHAGTRALAQAAPVNGATVRTTINPKLETAAIDALGGSYAGMTVLNARTGGIEAAAGQAFTDLQPPGSTFKIITTAAALSNHIATLNTTYPEESSASVGGFIMQNAGGEVCGGTLLASFASSCDTVFGPLGIQIGGKRLVTTALQFGFDHPTGIATALESQIPSVQDIGSDTAVGSTAIGQGKLEASTLEMADVGQAIANQGQRALPTFLAGAKARYVRVSSPTVAAEIQEAMQAVVSDGTGYTAAISGYHVAGKTGTAELASTVGQQNDVKDTDAWFVGYVPDSRAGIVACALFPANGYGAASAAPAVRQVLEAALGIN